MSIYYARDRNEWNENKVRLWNERYLTRELNTHHYKMSLLKLNSLIKQIQSRKIA